MSVQAGDEIPGWTMESVDREKMKTMAVLLEDSNLIHTDPAVVAALGLGDRPVNQGPANLAYALNMLAQWSGGFDTIADVNVRFLANVFSEDRVTAHGRVLSVDGRDADGGDLGGGDLGGGDLGGGAGGGTQLAGCEIRLEGPSGTVIQGTASVRLSGGR
jgi:acyl dehydratase